MIQNRFGNVMYIALWIIVAYLFMAANRVHVKRYPIYSMLVWEIKANEGYRSWWYPDGRHKINGCWRKSHSIGFGWNDIGGTRRNRIKQYTNDGKVTYNEALKITIAEIQKWGKLHNDPYKNLALQLYSYNCGPIKSGSKLGKCHGAKWGCGHKNPRVRSAHNRRRKFEMALWNKDWRLIQHYTEENRQKVANHYK